MADARRNGATSKPAFDGPAYGAGNPAPCSGLSTNGSCTGYTATSVEEYVMKIEAIEPRILLTAWYMFVMVTAVGIMLAGSGGVSP